MKGKDGGKGAPMSCALVYWGGDYQRFHDVFLRYGAVVNIEALKEVRIGDQRQLELSIE